MTADDTIRENDGERRQKFLYFVQMCGLQPPKRNYSPEEVIFELEIKGKRVK